MKKLALFFIFTCTFFFHAQSQNNVTLGILSGFYMNSYLVWGGTEYATFCEDDSVDVKLYLYNYTTNPFAWNYYKNSILLLSDTLDSYIFIISDTGTYSIVYACGAIIDSFIVKVTQGPPVPKIYWYDNTFHTDYVFGCSYRWYLNDTAINDAYYMHYAPSVSGVYKVKLSNEKGCVKYSRPRKYIVPEEPHPDGFSVGNLYPNPNDGTMNIDYSLSENHSAEIVLIDVTGRQVSSRTFVPNSASTLTISEPSLNYGYYFCQILLDGQPFSTTKFVVAK